MRRLFAKILQKNVKGFVTTTDEKGAVIGGWVYGRNWFLNLNTK